MGLTSSTRPGPLPPRSMESRHPSEIRGGRTRLPQEYGHNEGDVAEYDKIRPII